MKSLTIAALALSSMLAACGGGGGDPAPAPAVPAAVVPAPPPPETGPRSDLPAPLVGVVLAQPVAVFGDSMSAALTPGLRAALVADIYGGGVPGSVTWQAAQALAAYPEPARTIVIWTGHNNYADPQRVLDDIAGMVASLPHQRFVVLGLAYEDIPAEWIGGPGRALKDQINAALAAAYPVRYLDANRALQAWGNPRNPLDVASAAHGVTPSSLREFGLHVNAQGAQIIASEVAAVMRAAGW